MGVSEQRARSVLQQNEQFLREQMDVEDYDVGIGHQGEICIRIMSPEELPTERREAIQSQLGREVPVEFSRSSGGKRAY